MSFCAEMASELRRILLQTKIGVCWTLRGLAGSLKQYWIDLMDHLDVVVTTYYAVDGPTYAAASPSKYEAEFPGTLLSAAEELATHKPIVVQEIGMPSDSLLGSEAAQAQFLAYVLDQWDNTGLRISFLSGRQLYDLLYDPGLAVTQDGPGVNDPIVVTSSSGGIPKVFPGTQVAYWAPGNNLAQFFFGPKRPATDPDEPVVNADTVYWLEQSVGPKVAFGRFLSSCGLVRPSGTYKESYEVFRSWTKAR